VLPLTPSDNGVGMHCQLRRDEDGAPWSNSATLRHLHVLVGDLRCRRGDDADRELSQRLMSSEDRCLTQR
jgi:hypothetical protein